MNPMKPGLMKIKSIVQKQEALRDRQERTFYFNTKTVEAGLKELQRVEQIEGLDFNLDLNQKNRSFFVVTKEMLKNSKVEAIMRKYFSKNPIREEAKPCANCGALGTADAAGKCVQCGKPMGKKEEAKVAGPGEMRGILTCPNCGSKEDPKGNAECRRCGATMESKQAEATSNTGKKKNAITGMAAAKKGKKEGEEEGTPAIEATSNTGKKKNAVTGMAAAKKGKKEGEEDDAAVEATSNTGKKKNAVTGMAAAKKGKGVKEDEEGGEGGEEGGEEPEAGAPGIPDGVEVDGEGHRYQCTNPECPYTGDPQEDGTCPESGDPMEICMVVTSIAEPLEGDAEVPAEAPVEEPAAEKVSGQGKGKSKITGVEVAKEKSPVKEEYLDSVLEQLEVNSVGIEDDVYYVEINGKEYGYTPHKGMSMKDLADKFQGILKHNKGRALVWLKGNAEAVMGAKGTPGGGVKPAAPNSQGDTAPVEKVSVLCTKCEFTAKELPKGKNLCPKCYEELVVVKKSLDEALIDDANRIKELRLKAEAPVDEVKVMEFAKRVFATVYGTVDEAKLKAFVAKVVAESKTTDMAMEIVKRLLA